MQKILRYGSDLEPMYPVDKGLIKGWGGREYIYIYIYIYIYLHLLCLLLIDHNIDIICNQECRYTYSEKIQPKMMVSYRTFYTAINYFGRYATCSHKDGGRSHIESRETIGQEDHVTYLKLRPRVNFSPAFGATYKTRIFYKYVVFKHPCSLLPNFFAAATHSVQRESTGVKSNNMVGPRRHSKYTLTMRCFPLSEKLPVSNHEKRRFLNM